MAIIRPGKVQARLPEIGRIFKGSKKKENPKKPGTLIQGDDLDYFRFEPSASTYDLPSPDGEGRLADYLVRQYCELGDSPRALPIQFLHIEVDANFKADSNEVWATIGGTERCVRRCNGETQSLYLIEKEGKKLLSKDPIPCAALPGMNKCPMNCKPTGKLFFTMPCLHYPGLVVMTTHSIYDILEIQGNLTMYSNWDINKIPFQLCRSEKTVKRTNDDGSQVPVKKWLCHLTIDPRYGNAVFASQPRQYLAELTGSIDVEFIDESDEPTLKALPEAETTLEPSSGKTGQQKIVARICAVAKEAGFTPEARDVFLSESGYPSKNDIPQEAVETVVGWLTPERAIEWNAVLAQAPAL